jgi:ComF family protein
MPDPWSTATWRTVARHAGSALLELLLPCPCLACERSIGTWRPQLGLCVPCRGRLRPVGGACAQCGAPVVTPEPPAGFRCGRCRRSPPAFDRLAALFVYEPPLDAVVRGLKFARLPYLGRHVAALLAERHGESLAAADVVVPVPLHWRRRALRGYNQAAEIALPLARLLGLRPCHALRRRRATRPQADLPRAQRLSNPRGAFRVRRRASVAGRRVVLVDDIVTTTATVESAAAVLKRAGAAAVTVVALGRTPPPGEGSGRILEVTDARSSCRRR